MLPANPYFNHYSADSRAASMAVGYNDTCFLDASAGDATPADTTITTSADYWKNCRYISCDTTGIAKIDYVNERGETITEVKRLTQGVIYPIRNVIKLYRYYAAQTDGTVKSYNSAGADVANAIKLHR